MLAFVDESIRQMGVGAYVLGCVVVPQNECDDLRGKLRRRGPFHFNTATPQSRSSMLGQIQQWGLLSAGYVYRGLYLYGLTREGARQRCMERLLIDLQRWDVGELVIEARRPREDTFDAMTIIQAIRAERAPATLVYSWRSKREPMLWMADAIAGAVRALEGRPKSRRAATTVSTVRKVT